MLLNTLSWSSVENFSFISKNNWLLPRFVLLHTHHTILCNYIHGRDKSNTFLTRAGQWGCLDPLPSVFFFLEDISKPAAWCAAAFEHTCSLNFSSHVKISVQNCSRSGHQVTLSDLTSENVSIFVIVTPTERSSWNFQILITVTLAIKNVYLEIFTLVT